MVSKIQEEEERTKRNHVVIFPFLSKGHIIPLLHLSNTLSSRSIKVTLITTPANSAFFNQYLHLPNPNIHIQLLPFPQTSSLPPGIESSDKLPSFDLFPSLLHATALLDQPFRKALQDMVSSDDIPLCVISDFFSGWTFPICEEFGIPRIVFHGTGVLSLALCKALVTHNTHLGFASTDVDFHVPGSPENIRLKYSDVPESFKNLKDDEIMKFVLKYGEGEVNSWGVLVNSFDEMEEEYVPFLESFYKFAKAWLVGPLCLSPSTPPCSKTNDLSCLNWLDGKEPKSVIYVSFGTMVSWAEEQLDEIWHGLEMSSCNYLWVIRSETWSPPEKQSKGLVHKGWAPQTEVLRHGSVGGFLSHCGWNSVLESLSSETPILAWPVISEQKLNVKFVVDLVGMGLRVKIGGGVVGREEVCDGVRELMNGDSGRKVREKAAEMRRKAKSAVEEGGSSYQTLEKLVEELKANKGKYWGYFLNK